ncbi:nuclear pore complex protein NUP58 [Momordica charantia]|uniref:Nuclear pore complex protein NUP58 n=1 Tax=Momordica charantia TaxID=3673 RepID=A0A6J1BTQ0_MOMCH|nr:nuclear pore complex protein NUP58 [Momordica charantia]
MAFSLFSTPQPQQSFQPQPQSQPQLFQQSSPLFSQQQPQQFQLQQQQQQQQQQQLQLMQQQQKQQQLFIFTNDNAPASYGTKWADLHPDSQKILLQIEERILEYRDESQRLDQCSRLYDSSVSSDGFEHDASRIVQELGGISTSTEHQKVLLQELMTAAKGMLCNTEVAIRSFMMIRPRFLHQSAGGASNPTAPSQVPGAPSPLGSSGQPTSTSIVPVFDFYSGLPRKPSPFLEQTVSRFEKYLGECRQWIEEIEQLLVLDSNRSASNSSSLFHSLPKIMSNVHEFFVHVAAKVENIHQYIESMKAAYLADQRRRGDGNDPFLEADRRETARQEAAAKRVHPTLHLPANLQPSTQAAGLLASSGNQGASTVPQSFTVATPASSGGGLSLFSTPSAPSTASSSLFMTPTASVQTSSLFSSSGATAPTTLFGSSSAPLFSASTTTPFGSTAPSFGQSASAGSSLFSTPFASGAATGSGASFGATSKSSKPKSRTARRY